LLGVRFSQFIPFTMQMSLFENKMEKMNLYKAMDDIKDRFGVKSLTKAVTVKKDKGE
jgi:DNA polymerase IV